jgi:damage-control phosphatase, subfamily I
LKLHVECIPCYIRQVLDAAKLVTDDQKILENIIRTSLKAAYEFDPDIVGLISQSKIQNAVKHLMPEKDPYKSIKKKFNEICMGMEDQINILIINSNDKFEASLRIALAGNIIDFGPKQHLSQKIIMNAIKKSLVQKLDKNNVLLLKSNINKCRKILFIGDNAGEIVFDKIFIENLPKNKITYAVRGGPALNDSTIEDAKMVSMTGTVKVITTGLAMPAAILPLCSKEFLDEYNRADLIIAKGQGNYEALSDENQNIFFLLKIKCPVISENFNGKYKVGDIVVDRSTDNTINQ